jgi:hypothetical protein
MATERQHSIQQQIEELKKEREASMIQLKRQLRETGQSLKPGNLIRDAAKDVIENTDLRHLALKAAGIWVMALLLKKVAKKGEAYMAEREQKEENTADSHSFWDRTLDTLVAHGAEFVEEQLHHFMAKYEQTSPSDVHTTRPDRET